MARTQLTGTIALLVASACTETSAPVTPLVELAPPAAVTSAGPEAAIVSVAAVRAMPGVVIDGDLGDWGPFPPDPDDAASHLALALTSDAVLIAAELGEPARDGFWLGIGSRPAELPLIGQYFGRMGFVPLDCERTPVVSDIGDGEQGYGFEENPPETVAACKAFLARQAEVKAKHDRRFERWLRVDREGVRVMAEGGELVPVAGAKSVWKAATKGATLELSLPIAAMPRLAEAPLQSLRLVARAGSSPKPPGLAAGQWVWLALPDPISFEPYGELRAHALKRALDVGDDNTINTYLFKQARAASYQPGDPLHIEVVDSPGCDAFTPHDETLYRKQASLGDTEVGYVAAPRGGSCAVESEPWLAIFAHGKLAGIVAIEGSPHGVVTRDGELHVISYNDTSWGTVAGSWSVIAVAADGTHRPVTLERVAGTKEPEGPPYWEDASDFASKELDSFGWRGTRAGRGVEATWRWDAARRMYTGKQRNIQPTTRAKKRP